MLRKRSRDNQSNRSICEYAQFVDIHNCENDCEIGNFQSGCYYFTESKQFITVENMSSSNQRLLWATSWYIIII